MVTGIETLISQIKPQLRIIVIFFKPISPEKYCAC